jgi:hypothetical protein
VCIHRLVVVWVADKGNRESQEIIFTRLYKSVYRNVGYLRLSDSSSIDTAVGTEQESSYKCQRTTYVIESVSIRVEGS